MSYRNRVNMHKFDQPQLRRAAKKADQNYLWQWCYSRVEFKWRCQTGRLPEKWSHPANNEHLSPIFKTLTVHSLNYTAFVAVFSLEYNKTLSSLPYCRQTKTLRAKSGNRGQCQISNKNTRIQTWIISNNNKHSKAKLIRSLEHIYTLISLYWQFL